MERRRFNLVLSFSDDLDDVFCHTAAGARTAQFLFYAAIALEHALAVGGVGGNEPEFLFEAPVVEVLLEEFGDDIAVVDEVDQCDVVDAAADKGTGDGDGDGVAAIADYLRDVEESSLKGGGARADNGGIGTGEDGVGLVVDDLK